MLLQDGCLVTYYQVSQATPYLAQSHFRKTGTTTFTKIYWLLGRKSKLSTSNKLLIYKTILKPIWTYGIQLWDTASTSNIGILERFQLKAFHMIVDTPWYVLKTVIRRDLVTPTVKEEICHYNIIHPPTSWSS
jgi:hypothetical protein